MDTTAGAAVVCAMPEFELCPTLDLRVDYMRSAKPGQSVLHEPVVIEALKIFYSSDVKRIKWIERLHIVLQHLCEWGKREFLQSKQ